MARIVLVRTLSESVLLILRGKRRPDPGRSFASSPRYVSYKSRTGFQSSSYTTLASDFVTILFGQKLSHPPNDQHPTSILDPYSHTKTTVLVLLGIPLSDTKVSLKSAPSPASPQLILTTV